VIIGYSFKTKKPTTNQTSIYKQQSNPEGKNKKFQTAKKLFERVGHPLIFRSAQGAMAERVSSFWLCFCILFAPKSMARGKRLVKNMH